VLLEDAFPQSKEGPLEFKEVNLQLLFHALGQVQHCADPTSQRQYAQGIILTKNKLCATDGMRLATVPDMWFQPEKATALTLDTVTKLQKLFKGYTQGGIVIEKGEVFVTGGGIKAAGRLAAWPVPGIEKAIPASKGSPVRIDKEELQSALERALIVAHEKLPVTTIYFGEDGVRVYTDEDGQIAEDLIPASCPMRASATINPRYLLEAVKSVESEVVLLEMWGSEVPMRLTDEEGTHVNVVMPIQSTHG
jgi:DNA polymerase III sliding clamp (beta) subunit (PCNA family)